MKRVGVLVPATNIAVEAELNRHAPDGVSFHTARMFAPDTSMERMLDESVPTAIRDIAAMQPDVVLFACTSAGALRGAEYESKLMDEHSAKTGVPTVSVMSAVSSEMHEKGFKKVGVLTPYSDETNATIKSALEEQGFEIPIIAGLNVKVATDIPNTSPQTIIDLGNKVLPGHDLDAVFISCTALFTLDNLVKWEEAFGKPVLSSLSASLNQVEAKLGAAV